MLIDYCISATCQVCNVWTLGLPNGLQTQQTNPLDLLYLCLEQAVSHYHPHDGFAVLDAVITPAACWHLLH
jgi:hypothetical protein